MHGLLLIDKPQGMTSHDVVARVRRLIGIRAIGHAGTLDPFATGLLILCIGHATRLSEYLIGEVKRYTGRMKLGERTNTDDLEGQVVERRPVQVSDDDLQRARRAFTGNLLQVPPQYSAIQIGGQRAYQMARHGESVILPPRPIRIDELDLALAVDPEGEQREMEADASSHAVPSVVFVDLRVTCSAGTYVRALARDIGEQLGCGAHLVLLRRVQSGSFSLAEAITLDELQRATGGNWQRYLLPMDRAVEPLPRAMLDADASQRFLLGQTVTIPSMMIAGVATCRVYDVNGQFIAIGEYQGATSLLRPVKVFHTRK